MVTPDSIAIHSLACTAKEWLGLGFSLTQLSSSTFFPLSWMNWGGLIHLLEISTIHYRFRVLIPNILSYKVYSHNAVEFPVPFQLLTGRQRDIIWNFFDVSVGVFYLNFLRWLPRGWISTWRWLARGFPVCVCRPPYFSLPFFDSFLSQWLKWQLSWSKLF